MPTFKQILEWYLGVPQAGPGEGTAWRFGWQSLIPAGWPEWLAWLLLMVVVAGVVGLSLHESRRLPPVRRLVLLVLRLGTLTLLLMMASQVTLSVDRTGLPVLAMLVDDSASMGFVDGAQLSNGLADANRYDQLVAALEENEARLMNRLARRFRLRVYRFDRDAELLVREPAADAREIVETIRSISPDGDGTRPASAVRQTLDELRGLSPSAVLIFTDGASTTGEADALSSVAPLAARRKIPLFPIGVGQAAQPRDLDLFELVSDEMGFWGDPVRISVRFRAFGVPGENVTVTLVDTDSQSELANVTAPAPANGTTAHAELTFLPDREGTIPFEVRLSMSPEEANMRNNVRSGRVHVRRQKLRVLLADGAPRYEFRYLKFLLEREPTIDLDTVLQDSDLGYEQQDETALERFPMEADQLFAYDVILFGDLDPGLLGSDVLTILSNFVRTKGGGLIGIAGPSFFPHAYAGTPLEQVLPVAAGSVRVPEATDALTTPLRPRRTLQAERSGPMFRLDNDGAKSEEIWNTLPGIYWHASPGTLQPGAVPLVTVTGADGRSEPLILLQRFGAGRTLLHLTDETWRWRYQVGDAYFGRYWGQTIRYMSALAQSSDGDQSPPLELASDRRNYSQGETITLRAREREGHSLEQSVVQVIVEDRGGQRREVPLSRTGELSSVFEGRLEQLPEGAYHAWIQTPAVSGTPASTDFSVEPSQLELAIRAPQLADLREAAQLSGGKYFSLEEVARLPQELPSGKSVRLEASSPLPLWSRPELLLLLATLLTAEWLLRKRGRLT